MAAKTKQPAKKVVWNPADLQYLATHPVAVAHHPMWAKSHPVTVRRAKVQRAKNAANANPLYNPLAQLGGYDLQQAANKIAGVQIDPAVNAINAQIKTAQGVGAEQGKRAEGYYTELAKEVQGGLDQQRAIADRLNQSLAGIASDTAEKTGQAGQAAGQALQGDQAIRGPVTSSDALQREMAAALASQGKDAQTFRSTGAQSGAAGQSLGQTTLDASRLRGGEVQTDIMGRTRQTVNDLGQKRTDVEATRGGLVAKALADLRQNEFEKFATVKGLGIKEADLVQSGQIAGQRDRTTRRGQNLTHSDRVRGQDITARGQDLSHGDRVAAEQGRNWRATLKRGPNGNLSVSSNNRVTGQVNTAWSYLHRLPKGSRAAVLKAMQAGQTSGKDKDGNTVHLPKVDPWAAQAAFDLVQTGRMSSAVYHRLRGLGYQPPAQWLPHTPVIAHGY